MIHTPRAPYILVVSQVMKNEVKNKNGIVRAVRGETRERSPYFTALSAVIVVTALIQELISKIQRNLRFISEKSSRNTNGSKSRNEKSLVPQASEYSSSESSFLISVNDFPASSHSDLRNATASARNIHIISSLYLYTQIRILLLFPCSRYFFHRGWYFLS